MFYDRFKALCEDRGISCNRAAAEIGLSNATPTTWKKRGLTPKSDTLTKIADYFGVTTDYLLGAEEKKPTSTAGEQTQNISEKEIRAAFFNGADPTLTEDEMAAMWEDAKTYLHFKLEQRKKQKYDT